MVNLALRSRYAIIRQSAARCFATICDVMTVEAMRYTVEHIVPLLGDALTLANRQGAIELIHRLYHFSFHCVVYLLTSLCRHSPEARYQSSPVYYILDKARSWADE